MGNSAKPIALLKWNHLISNRYALFVHHIALKYPTNRKNIVSRLNFFTYSTTIIHTQGNWQNNIFVITSYSNLIVSNNVSVNGLRFTYLYCVCYTNCNDFSSQYVWYTCHVANLVDFKSNLVVKRNYDGNNMQSN